MLPRKPNFIFEVHIRIAEAFTLDSIVRSPRTFKPKDVQSACQNNELVLKSGSPPQPVVNLATYVMTDFFALAHATGLYNRQRALWESLSKVNSIYVYQLSSGLFQKTPLPVFDFSFLGYKGKPLLYANLISSLPEKQAPLSLLKAFIGRAQGKPSLTGVLCCFPNEVPAPVLEYVRRQTATSDTIGRYESIMPALHVPFDLLCMNDANLLQLSKENADPPELRTVFSLVHPDLKKSTQALKPPRAMRKVTPKKKQQNQEETEGAVAADSNNEAAASDQNSTLTNT